jgi:GNAT superfamily N-acetyltransferase
VVGGLSARTYWDWLEIDDLFVPETLRGQGLGSSLLQTAEMMAIGRGARRRNRPPVARHPDLCWNLACAQFVHTIDIGPKGDQKRKKSL